MPPTNPKTQEENTPDPVDGEGLPYYDKIFRLKEGRWLGATTLLPRSPAARIFSSTPWSSRCRRTCSSCRALSFLLYCSAKSTFSGICLLSSMIETDFDQGQVFRRQAQPPCGQRPPSSSSERFVQHFAVPINFVSRSSRFLRRSFR